MTFKCHWCADHCIHDRPVSERIGAWMSLYLYFCRQPIAIIAIATPQPDHPQRMCSWKRIIISHHILCFVFLEITKIKWNSNYMFKLSGNTYLIILPQCSVRLQSLQKGSARMLFTETKTNFRNCSGEDIQWYFTNLIKAQGIIRILSVIDVYSV